jgi:hypothetical protein
LGATRQLPKHHDLESVAGRPLTVSFTASTGVTTFGPPTCTITDEDGTQITTDPGQPVTSGAGTTTITAAWSTADTAALNTSRRTKRLRYTLAATADSNGPYDWISGEWVLHPIGVSAATTTAATVTGNIVLGSTITGDVTVSGPFFAIDGGRPDEEYGGGLTSIDGGAYSDTYTDTTYDGGTP